MTFVLWASSAKRCLRRPWALLLVLACAVRVFLVGRPFLLRLLMPVLRTVLVSASCSRLEL